MDGESQAAQAARLRELWRRLAGKKDMLDLAALREGLKKINHPLKDADNLIRDMLSACDSNHDGMISFDEFVHACRQTEQDLWKLFQSIDKDKSGNLEKSELKAAFARAGVSCSNARLERFIAHVDKDQDGAISFDEWRDFLLFIPTNAPSLKAVFSYYYSTVKISAEGDVHLTDEALNSLGTTLSFIQNSLFGAISQIVHPSPSNAASAASPQLSLPQQSASPAQGQTQVEAPWEGQHRQDDMKPEDDPHMPVKPARRKGVEQVQLKLTDLVPDVGYFIAGGVSGITSRTVTAPLDRLKVYLIAQTGNTSEAVQAAKSGAALQVTKHGAASLWNACQELWAAGGIRSLFAGNGLNVIKVMPESAVKFGSYEASKRAVAAWEGHGETRNISPGSQFVAGGVAGMISQAVVYPLDTLKFRMQCETVPGGEKGNRLIWHTMCKMWAKNGIVGFYRGLPMGLIGMFPYAAIDLFTFETLKRRLVNRNMKELGVKHEEDALPNNFTLAIMGGFSGAFGASVVYPLNLLRTRLQSQGTAGHPRTYTGIMDVTRQTLKGEGVRGLFKGLTPNLLKVVPAVSITYVVYENTKKALHLH